jgi:ATP-dependent Clp protease ATP-binding subunit ClpC
MPSSDALSAESLQVVERARACARRLCRRTACTEHLLLALLESDDLAVITILSQFNAQPKRLREAIEFVIGSGARSQQAEPQLSASAHLVLDYARQEAHDLHAGPARPEHILLGLLREQDGIAAGVLESFHITYEAARAHVAWLSQQGYQHTAFTAEHMARVQATPTLNMVSRDLTSAALAGALDPLIGREDELERTMQVLSRRIKNNPVLIGEAGVGKTAIAEGLAQRIVQGLVPECLKRQRVVALDVGLLTIGTKYRGDFEERLKRIVAEIVAAHNLIIVVDELHTLIGAGVAEGSVDAANLLKPILARGEFRCLGTTTLADYRKTIERDPALERRFQPIIIREATLEEAIAVLRGLRERYEQFHGVKIADEAIAAAVMLSARYIHSRQLPDKALDLLDEAAARLCVGRSILPASVRELRERLVLVREDKDAAIDGDSFAMAASLWQQERQLRAQLMEAEDAWRREHASDVAPVVGEREIATVVAAWTGVPAVKLSLEESARLLKLEDELHRHVIGQDRAVATVARAVRRSRSEVRDRRRPIGTFIFAGPTGVGKTELARALAQSLFGDQDALITLDMAEFMEAHYAARLVGAPPGFTGYDQAGQLTEAVHRRPYSIVLFDEIEKASPRIFDLLLQICEDGRLADAKGRETDFRNTIVILTTNAGTQHALERGSMGFARDSGASREQRLREQVRQELRNLFRPELINRLDDVIVFHPLEADHLRRIADLMLSSVQERLREHHLTLIVDNAARDLLVARGSDPHYGARPLRRAIQHLLEDPLADAMLRGTFQPGDTIAVSAAGGALAFSQVAPASIAARAKAKGRG